MLDIPQYDTRLSSMHGSREAVYQGSHCNVNKRNLAQLPGLSSPGKLLTATAAATAGAEVYFVNKATRFAGAARVVTIDHRHFYRNGRRFAAACERTERWKRLGVLRASYHESMVLQINKKQNISTYVRLDTSC